MASLALASSLLIFSGCAWREKRQHARLAAAATPSLPQPIFVGTVTVVNETEKFALIDSGRLSGPPTGGTLRSYTNGTESAELVVSKVRRNPFAIANIRSGTPHQGDRVMLEPVLPATAVVPAPVTGDGR